MYGGYVDLCQKWWGFVLSFEISGYIFLFCVESVPELELLKIASFFKLGTKWGQVSTLLNN